MDDSQLAYAIFTSAVFAVLLSFIKITAPQIWIGKEIKRICDEYSKRCALSEKGGILSKLKMLEKEDYLVQLQLENLSNNKKDVSNDSSREKKIEILKEWDARFNDLQNRLRKIELREYDPKNDIQDVRKEVKKLGILRNESLLSSIFLIFSIVFLAIFASPNEAMTAGYFSTFALGPIQTFSLFGTKGEERMEDGMSTIEKIDSESTKIASEINEVTNRFIENRKKMDLFLR